MLYSLYKNFIILWFGLYIVAIFSLPVTLENDTVTRYFHYVYSSIFPALIVAVIFMRPGNKNFALKGLFLKIFTWFPLVLFIVSIVLYFTALHNS